MRVLVTGAGGNLGTETLRCLLAAGHEVRAFDRLTRQTRKNLVSFGKRVQTLWGDIADPDDVQRAVEGQDVVLHNAAIVPPSSELTPELSRCVNVEGTRHVIEAAQAQPTSPRVLLASSIAVYGPCLETSPPRRTQDELRPTDHYSHHKVECETMLQQSGLTWSIFRIGASPPLQTSGSGELLRFMFRHSLDSRVEFVHPADVGYAQARIVSEPEAWEKILLIGGGPRCQLYNRDMLQRTFIALGVGPLPERAFANQPLYGDWLDTRESQALLGYQQHTFEDFLDEVARALRVARLGSRFTAPLVRRILLRYSEAYRA